MLPLLLGAGVLALLVFGKKGGSASVPKMPRRPIARPDYPYAPVSHEEWQAIEERKLEAAKHLEDVQAFSSSQREARGRRRP